MTDAYRIPERNMDGLRKQIEKLNRARPALASSRSPCARPAKSSSCGPRHTSRTTRSRFGSRYTQVRRWRRPRNAPARCSAAGLEFHPRRYVLIEVTGAAPKIAGWSFVAVLQHLEGGNVLAHVPGWEGKIPDAYRDAQPLCYHCRTNREQKDTYLVCSDGDEWKHVGRQCLRDFTGHKDPHAIAEWAEALAMFAGACSAAEYDDDFGGGERGSRWISLTSFMAAAAWCVRRYGWVSRKQAKKPS